MKKWPSWNFSAGTLQPVSPWRWLFSILVPLVLTLRAMKRRSLDKSGALGGECKSTNSAVSKKGTGLMFSKVEFSEKSCSPLFRRILSMCFFYSKFTLKPVKVKKSFRNDYALQLYNKFKHSYISVFRTVKSSCL